MGYTVPQSIRIENIEKTAEVFFRVKKVMKSSVIKLKGDEKILKTYKREHMAPGEMEHILIPRDVLLSANGGLTISAEEEVTI